MNQELKTAVTNLRGTFSALLALAPARLPSMEPYPQLTLATAKMSKLQASIEWESPMEGFTAVIDSFTEDFYNAMNAELKRLLPNSRQDEAYRLFDDFKAQVSSIHRNLHASNSAEAEHQLTDEEAKVAEMMAAFGMKR